MRAFVKSLFNIFLSSLLSPSHSFFIFPTLPPTLTLPPSLPPSSGSRSSSQHLPLGARSSQDSLLCQDDSQRHRDSGNSASGPGGRGRRCDRHQHCLWSHGPAGQQCRVAGRRDRTEDHLWRSIRKCHQVSGLRMARENLPSTSSYTHHHAPYCKTSKISQFKKFKTKAVSTYNCCQSALSK